MEIKAYCFFFWTYLLINQILCIPSRIFFFLGQLKNITRLHKLCLREEFYVAQIFFPFFLFQKLGISENMEV